MDETEGHDGHGLWLASGLRSRHQHYRVPARPPDTKLGYVGFRHWVHLFVCFLSFPGEMRVRQGNDRSGRQQQRSSNIRESGALNPK